jgi:hypothetical protein
VLIVCKLDRLTRSLVDLLDILKKIEAADAAFQRIIAVSHNAIRESFNHASKEQSFPISYLGRNLSAEISVCC